MINDYNFFKARILKYLNEGFYVKKAEKNYVNVDYIIYRKGSDAKEDAFHVVDEIKKIFSYGDTDMIKRIIRIWSKKKDFL